MRALGELSRLLLPFLAPRPTFWSGTGEDQPLVITRGYTDCQSKREGNVVEGNYGDGEKGDEKVTRGSDTKPPTPVTRTVPPGPQPYAHTSRTSYLILHELLSTDVKKLTLACRKQDTSVTALLSATLQIVCARRAAVDCLYSRAHKRIEVRCDVAIDMRSDIFPTPREGRGGKKR